MASHYEAPIRKPLVTGNKSYHDVTVDVAAPVEGVLIAAMVDCFGIALTALMWGVGVSFILFQQVLELGFKQNSRLGMGYN